MKELIDNFWELKDTLQKFVDSNPSNIMKQDINLID